MSGFWSCSKTMNLFLFSDSYSYLSRRSSRFLPLRLQLTALNLLEMFFSLTNESLE